MRKRGGDETILRFDFWNAGRRYAKFFAHKNATGCWIVRVLEFQFLRSTASRLQHPLLLFRETYKTQVSLQEKLNYSGRTYGYVTRCARGLSERPTNENHPVTGEQCENQMRRGKENGSHTNALS